MVGHVPDARARRRAGPLAGLERPVRVAAVRSSSTICRTRSIRPTGCGPTPTTTSARDSPHFFGREFIDPARYQRIRQVLESKERHSAVDFGALQADEVSLPARRIAALLVEHLAPGRPRSSGARWKSCGAGTAALSADSCGRGDLRGVPQRAGAGAAGRRARRPAAGAARASGRTRCWARPTRTTSCRRSACCDFLRGRADDPVVVRRAFRATVRAGCSKRLGPNVERWQWGRLHPLQLRARAVDAQAAGHAVRRAGVPVERRPRDRSRRRQRCRAATTPVVRSRPIASSPTAAIGTTACPASPAARAATAARRTTPTRSTPGAACLPPAGVHPPRDRARPAPHRSRFILNIEAERFEARRAAARAEQAWPCQLQTEPRTGHARPVDPTCHVDQHLPIPAPGPTCGDAIRMPP